MLRAMASALAGSVGSIAAPLASLNQLATSTAIVKFFVSLASVTGGSNLIAISASISEVKVKAWVVLLASVKTPVTLTLIPWKSGCAARKALAPGSSSSGFTASSFAWIPLYVPAGTYSGIQAKLDAVKPDDDEPGASAFLAAHPDFQGISVKVTGVFTDASSTTHAFTFTSEIDAEMAMRFEPPVTLASDTKNFTIAVDVASWF